MAKKRETNPVPVETAAELRKKAAEYQRLADTTTMPKVKNFATACAAWWRSAAVQAANEERAGR